MERENLGSFLEQLLTQADAADDPKLALTPAQLADRLGIAAGDTKKREALRQRLVAWRKKNLEGWFEDETSTSRQPKYRYCLGSVWDRICDLETSEKI